MHRSSESVAALATALAKAQIELVNPEKSLVATIPAGTRGEAGQSFRYASLSSGLDIIRKTLGRHEIAIVQTTAVDQPRGTVNLTTLLAHTSGEWISSEWPVCSVADTNAPRRMGAALTYARRYALFTLVGIAGEDDLDAPDLNGGIQPNQASAPSGGTAPPPARPGNGVDQRTGRNAKAIAGADKAVLDAEPSAALRDQLLTEIAGLGSAEETAIWARRVLQTKNRLTATDASLVEEAFAARMISSETPRGGGEGTPLVSTPVVIDGPIVPDSDAPKGVDKSALTFGEPRRHRNKVHLAYVASLSCLMCGRRPSDPHHLRFAQPRTLGRKVSDEFTVPLCRTHHRQAHHVGNERAWWKSTGIDPIDQSRALWSQTRQGISAPTRKAHSLASPRKTNAKESGANGAG